MSFFKSKSFKVLVGLFAGILLLGGGIYAYKYYKLKKQKEATEAVMNPVLEKLRKQAAAQNNNYDLEETIRIINGLDEAMNQSEDFPSYMRYMAKQDYSKVAPDVIAARMDLLEILGRLYATQTELKDQQSMWQLSKELTAITLNSATSMAAAGTFDLGGLGKESAKGVKESFAELRKREEITRKLKKDLAGIETELTDELFDYSKVYYKYMSEWDKVCLQRDKAYLAVNSGNFEAANQSLAKALQQNPDDKESLLLKSLVLIESQKSNEVLSMETPMENPLDVLNDYIQKNPDETAPALLLMGVYQSKQGELAAANLSFQQAAAYYPRQSEQLTDMLNPYQMRSYLKKSREGNYIVDLYKSMMLGSGYFSPDLQMARKYFDEGEFEKGKEKVLDHFSRRRNQAQWDNLLSDIDFCRQLMEKDFTKIFPEQSFLNLNADITTFGNKLNVVVNNQSQRKLTNVSLVMCIQFTDMHRDDYATFKLEKTLPALEPNAKNDFGKLELNYDLFGVKKTSKDIVSYRAVLISNEAISWLENDEFRLKELKEETPEAADAQQSSSYLSAFGVTTTSLQDEIRKLAYGSFSETLYGLGTDDLAISLPKSLAVLKPVFRLKDKNGNELAPEQNVLGGKDIKLGFSQNAKDSGDTFALLLYSKYLNAEITFVKKDGKFSVSSVKNF